MSIPDHELDEPDYCELHGRELPCWLCEQDWQDLYSDWQVSDR